MTTRTRTKVLLTGIASLPAILLSRPQMQRSSDVNRKDNIYSRRVHLPPTRMTLLTAGSIDRFPPFRTSPTIMDGNPHIHGRGGPVYQAGTCTGAGKNVIRPAYLILDARLWRASSPAGPSATFARIVQNSRVLTSRSLEIADLRERALGDTIAAETGVDDLQQQGRGSPARLRPSGAVHREHRTHAGRRAA
jgi:hypothetical protein